MKTKAVLILGGNGFVGSALAHRFSSDFKVFTSYHKKPFKIPGTTPVQVDILERDKMKRIMYRIQPDVVVICAGRFLPVLTANTEKELEGQIDEAVQSNGPANVALSTDIIQPKIIYVSSCHVFDGRSGNFHENDITLPAGDFGKVKIGGENYTRRSFNYAIVRASPLYGFGNPFHPSFLDHYRALLSQGVPFEVPHFESYSFAPVWGFADFMTKVVTNAPKGKIFHYGGLQKMTLYDFMVQFAKHFKLDENLIRPRQMDVANNLIKKPDFSLNCTATSQYYKTKLYEINEGLEELI